MSSFSFLIKRGGGTVTAYNYASIKVGGVIMSGLMYPGGSGKTRFAVCHMAGSEDLKPSAICFKLYRNKIDSARLINIAGSTQSAFGTVLNAGSSNTYYNPGGQSGRTVGLIIYEEIQ